MQVPKDSGKWCKAQRMRRRRKATFEFETGADKAEGRSSCQRRSAWSDWTQRRTKKVLKGTREPDSLLTVVVECHSRRARRKAALERSYRHWQ